jgi:hypothetical protein
MGSDDAPRNRVQSVLKIESYTNFVLDKVMNNCKWVLAMPNVDFGLEASCSCSESQKFAAKNSHRKTEIGKKLDATG